MNNPRSNSFCISLKKHCGEVSSTNLFHFVALMLRNIWLHVSIHFCVLKCVECYWVFLILGAFQVLDCSLYMFSHLLMKIKISSAPHTKQTAAASCRPPGREWSKALHPFLILAVKITCTLHSAIGLRWSFSYIKPQWRVRAHLEDVFWKIQTFLWFTVFILRNY